MLFSETGPAVPVMTSCHHPVPVGSPEFSVTYQVKDIKKVSHVQLLMGNLMSHDRVIRLHIWDHAVLPATRHTWTRPGLTPASKLVLDLPTPDWPGGMEGWVDLGYPAMHQPGIEPVISRSQVQRPTTTLPSNTAQYSSAFWICIPIQYNTNLRCGCGLKSKGLGLKTGFETMVLTLSSRETIVSRLVLRLWSWSQLLLICGAKYKIRFRGLDLDPAGSGSDMSGSGMDPDSAG